LRTCDRMTKKMFVYVVMLGSAREGLKIYTSIYFGLDLGLFLTLISFHIIVCSKNQDALYLTQLNYLIASEQAVSCWWFSFLGSSKPYFTGKTHVHIRHTEENISNILSINKEK